MCLPGEFVTDHLNIDCLTHVVPDAADKVFVNPGLELTHPVPLSALTYFATCHLTLRQALATLHMVCAASGGGRACVDSPESRLSGTLALTIATSAAWRAHVALRWEAVAGGVHGLTHVARLWGGVVHIALGRALELVVVTVVERHAG